MTSVRYLVADRNTRGDKSWIDGIDAQEAVHAAIGMIGVAVVHAEVRSRGERAMGYLERMFGARSRTEATNHGIIKREYDRVTAFLLEDSTDVCRDLLRSENEYNANDAAQKPCWIRSRDVAGSDVQLLIDPTKRREGLTVEIATDLWLTGAACYFRYDKDNKLPLQREPSKPVTALLAALRTSSAAAANLLVDRNLAVRCRIKDAIGRSYDSVAVVLPRGASENQGGAPIAWAKCQPDVVNIDSRYCGMTALRVAAILSYGGVVSGLLDSGADPKFAADALAKTRRTALHDIASAAVSRDEGPSAHQRSMASLVKYARGVLAAVPELKYELDARGRSPAHHAAARGNGELLALFLKLRAIEKTPPEGFDDFLNGFDDDGWTPLAIAIHHGHLGCANQLLAHEADSLAVRKPKKGRRPHGFTVPSAFHLGLLQLYHLNHPEDDPHTEHNDRSASEKAQDIERSLALAKQIVGAMCDTECVKEHRGVYITKYLSWAGISYLGGVLLLTYVAIRTSTGFSNANSTYFDQIGQLVPGDDFPGTTGALDTFSHHVQDIGSMWEWVQEVLVDDLIPGDGSGLIDGHNQMVGSIRFRQQRMRETACRTMSPGITTSLLEGPSQMIIDETGVCYSTTAYEKTPIALGDPEGTISEFKRHGVASSSVRGWFAFGSFRGHWPFSQAGHVVDVSPYNRSNAVALVDAMVDSAWVDDATRVVWIDWTM